MAELEGFDNPTGFDAPPNVNQPGSDFITSEGGFGYEKIPHLKSKEEYDALTPGATYVSPEGERLIKRHTPKTKAEYDALPEGAPYLSPEGDELEKPKYEGVDFTANTLYHMAVNDKERKKALERSYPGRVRGDTAEDFHVEDEGGVLRKPKGFTEAPGSFVTGIAAPTIGAVYGGIAGGASGGAAGAVVGAPTGPGLVGTAAVGATAGATAGSALGSMGGQAFNDIIMQVAGVYDRSAAEEVGNLGWAATFGAGGELAGRGIAAAVGATKNASQFVATKVAKLLGAEPEAVATARALTDQGVIVPPSAWAKEAPHVQNIAEVLDPAFRTQKPLQQSAERHYEKTARKLLEDMGVEVEGSVAKPSAAVSTKEAGEAVLARAVRESQEADAAFAESLKLKLEAVAAKGSGIQSSQQGVLTAAKEARDAAQNLLNEGYKDIEKTIDGGMKVAKAGSNSGDLWWSVGEKLQAVRAAVQARHSQWYAQADEAAGGALPDARDLPARAATLLERLPEGFEGQYPGIVQRIRDLAGKQGADGEWIKEPQYPTFGQLHDLRSVLRNQIDWWKLNSDFKNGALKHLQNGVNDVLHEPGEHEGLKVAARLLDATDRSYAENMAIFNSRQLNAVMKGMQAGVPADEATLYNALFKEGHTELTAKVMDMVGPELRAGLRSADMKAMLDSAKTLVPGEVNGATFSKEVLDRVQSNMLETIHGPEVAAKLLKQAQHIQMLEGKLAIPVKPGDTALDLISRARMAAEVAETEAKRDPLKMLSAEMKKITADHAKELKAMQSARRQDKLGFLYEPTMGAAKAVDRILGSEDLILASASQFGHASPEFELLRQVYVKRLLQDTIKPGDALANITPEIQQVMFPGVTLGQMKTLAKEMDFLLETKAGRVGAGSSIMATEAVEHPWARVGGKLGKFLPKVPGMDFAGRALLTKYYGFITELSSNPAFLRWIDKGLNGDEQARQMTKQAIQRHIQKGGALGAGAAESQYQAGTE